MADRIKVAVLEGDYADLCGLGLPLSLRLQLQLQDLKLSGALWSSKASASDFSVSLYWPTITAPEKAQVKTRSKRKRGRARKQAIPSVSNIRSNVTTVSSAPVLATPAPVSESTPSPINAHPSPETPSKMSVMHGSSCSESVSSPQLKPKTSVTHGSVDLAACTDVQYEVKDGVHGVSYRCLLYTSPSPRDATLSRMPSSA